MLTLPDVGAEHEHVEQEEDASQMKMQNTITQQKRRRFIPGVSEHLHDTELRSNTQWQP